MTEDDENELLKQRQLLDDRIKAIKDQKELKRKEQEKQDYLRDKKWIIKSYENNCFQLSRSKATPEQEFLMKYLTNAHKVAILAYVNDHRKKFELNAIKMANMNAAFTSIKGAGFFKDSYKISTIVKDNTTPPDDKLTHNEKYTALKLIHEYTATKPDILSHLKTKINDSRILIFGTTPLVTKASVLRSLIYMMLWNTKNEDRFPYPVPEDVFTNNDKTGINKYFKVTKITQEDIDQNTMTDEEIIQARNITTKAKNTKIKIDTDEIADRINIDRIMKYGYKCKFLKKINLAQLI